MALYQAYSFCRVLFTIYLIITNALNWPFLPAAVYFVYTRKKLGRSTWSILFEEITFHKLKKKRDVLKLLATAMLEPFYPVHTYFAIRGNFEGNEAEKGWGKPTGSGFDKEEEGRAQTYITSISKHREPDLI